MSELTPKIRNAIAVAGIRPGLVHVDSSSFPEDTQITVQPSGQGKWELVDDKYVKMEIGAIAELVKKGDSLESLPHDVLADTIAQAAEDTRNKNGGTTPAGHEMISTFPGLGVVIVTDPEKGTMAAYRNVTPTREGFLSPSVGNRAGTYGLLSEPPVVQGRDPETIYQNAEHSIQQLNTDMARSAGRGRQL